MTVSFSFCGFVFRDLELFSAAGEADGDCERHEERQHGNSWVIEAVNGDSHEPGGTNTCLWITASKIMFSGENRNSKY